MTRHRIAILLTLACAFAILAPARAQQPLPANVVQAPALSPDAAKQVADYVADPLKKLESAEFKDIKSARERLLEPLKTSGVSVAFRAEYTRLLLPSLSKLASGPSELNAVNALRIMGEIATSDALDELDKRTKDQNPPVRYAAISGVAHVLDSIRDNPVPAILQGRATDTVGKLGELLSVEVNPEIAAAIARALTKQFTLERQGFEPVRIQALAALTKGVKARAAALAVNGASPTPQLPLLVAICTEARNAMAQANPNLQLNAQGKLEVAEIAGDCMAVLLRAVKAGQIAPGDREFAAQLADTAESVILLAAGRQNLAANLGADLRKGDADGDKAFLDKVLKLFTTLSEPPLNFKPERFVK